MWLAGKESYIEIDVFFFGEIDQHILARMLSGKGRQAEAAEAEGMRCLDHWAQWLRFVIGSSYIFLSVARYAILQIVS